MATYNEYLDKETLINNPGIPDINKVKADDMNYIKYNLPHIGTSVDSSYRTNILHSKNLFNKATVVVGYYKNANGTPIVDNTACYSELIQVDTTKQYYSNKTISIVYYNSSKQPVGTLTGTFTGAFTPTYPYIVINVLQVDLDTFQLEKGSSATSYEPYITPSIVVDNEEIYNKSDIDNLLAFDERVDDRFYTKFLNTSSSSAFGITIKGSIDRQTYLVMGVNNAMGSVLSIITSSSSTTNVKNLGTVNLSVSRSGSNISVSGMGQYTYVSVIGYDDFTLYR